MSNPEIKIVLVDDRVDPTPIKSTPDNLAMLAAFAKVCAYWEDFFNNPIHRAERERIERQYREGRIEYDGAQWYESMSLDKETSNEKT